MAVASLVVALVGGWCPLTGLVAIVLGGVALRRIAGARDRLRGTGHAVAGILLSTVIMLAEGWALGELQDSVIVSIDDQASAMVDGALHEGDVRWALPAPEPDTLAQFRQRIGEAIGPVRTVSITRRDASGLASPVISVAFTAIGERGNAFGVATFSTVPGQLPPPLSMRTITVQHADQTWSIPPTDPAP
jgi:hypothetical protein